MILWRIYDIFVRFLSAKQKVREKGFLLLFFPLCVISAVLIVVSSWRKVGNSEELCLVDQRYSLVWSTFTPCPPPVPSESGRVFCHQSTGVANESSSSPWKRRWSTVSWMPWDQTVQSVPRTFMCSLEGSIYSFRMCTYRGGWSISRTDFFWKQEMCLSLWMQPSAWESHLGLSHDKRVLHQAYYSYLNNQWLLPTLGVNEL